MAATFLRWCALVIAIVLALPIAAASPDQEKDSYEIYSFLLRKEQSPQPNISAWAIAQKTTTFPSDGEPNGRSPAACLQTPPDQESIYLPLIEDYIAKNKQKLMLKPKFDLQKVALIDDVLSKAIHDRWIQAMSGLAPIPVVQPSQYFL